MTYGDYSETQIVASIRACSQERSETATRLLTEALAYWTAYRTEAALARLQAAYASVARAESTMRAIG
jgi:hypothetical protein